MISTVTTTTVTTITALASAGSLVMFSIVLLLAFLVQKELASATENRFAMVLGRVLNIAIFPLFLGFVFIVAIKVVEITRMIKYAKDAGVTLPEEYKRTFRGVHLKDRENKVFVNGVWRDKE